MGAELSNLLFGHKTPFFPNIFNICVCVFCGECGCICMISICVADSSYKAIYFIYLFITQIILIVFFSGQINDLYDV